MKCDTESNLQISANEVGFGSGTKDWAVMRCDQVEIAGHELQHPAVQHDTLPCIRAVTETQHSAGDVI